MYNLIHDVDELKYFFDYVIPPLKNSEVYFLSLSARNKYLTEEERQELALGRTEMFERKIVRTRDFNRFLRTIRKFEANTGAYTTKNNSYIPEKSIIVYFNINPSNVLKAYKEFNQTMNEYMFELVKNTNEGRDTENIMYRIRKLDTLLMNCFQKNRGTKHYIDVDLDIPKDYYDPIILYFLDRLKENNIEYIVVDTKGGYHILLKSATIKQNPYALVYDTNERCVKEYMKRHNITNIKELCGERDHVDMKKDIGYEIIINKNAMIPTPGTFAGGYPIKILEV